MWFIYSLIGALITGIGQVLVKRGQINLPPLLDNFLATIIVITTLIPFLLIVGVDIKAGKDIWAYALLAATMYSTFYYIINKGSVSLMISLINTFPVVTILLAILFLGEFPNSYQWFGIAMIIVAVLFMSREKPEKRVVNENKTWIIWGLLGAIAIGSAEFVTKIATSIVDGFTFTFFVYLMYIPPLIVFMLFDKKGRKFKTLKHKSGLLYTVIGIFFIEAGLIAIALAYQHGLASLVSPVIATHMLITVVLAIIFLQEKVSGVQKIGILLDIIGVSIIGIWA